MTLTQKTCVPCHGGIPPLTADEAAGYLAQVPGWALSEDTERISRKFEFPDFKAAMAIVHGVSNRHADLNYRPADFGSDGVFHLHGFHHQDQLSLVHKVSRLHVDADNGSLHGRGNRAGPLWSFHGRNAGQGRNGGGK